MFTLVISFFFAIKRPKRSDIEKQREIHTVRQTDRDEERENFFSRGIHWYYEKKETEGELI